MVIIILLKIKRLKMIEIKVQHFVHIEHSVYDDIEDLLASHTDLTTIEPLRHLIIQVASLLEMDLKKDK